MEDTKIATYDYRVLPRPAYTISGTNNEKKRVSAQSLNDCVREICANELNSIIEALTRDSKEKEYDSSVLSIHLGDALVKWNRNKTAFTLQETDPATNQYEEVQNVTFDTLVTRLAQELAVTNANKPKKLSRDNKFCRIVAIGRKHGEVIVRTNRQLLPQELLAKKSYTPNQQTGEIAKLPESTLPLRPVCRIGFHASSESTHLSGQTYGAEKIESVSYDENNIAQGLAYFDPKYKPIPVLAFFAGGILLALPAIWGVSGDHDALGLSADIAGSALNLGALLTVVFEATALILFVAMAAQELSRRNKQNPTENIIGTIDSPSVGC